MRLSKESYEKLMGPWCLQRSEEGWSLLGQIEFVHCESEEVLFQKDVGVNKEYDRYLGRKFGFFVLRGMGSYFLRGNEKEFGSLQGHWLSGLEDMEARLGMRGQLSNLNSFPDTKLP